MLAITIISIFVLAGLAWLLNKMLALSICPICAGVSGTWIWILAARFLGYPVDLLIPAILMGGSVVGIAFQVEKKLHVGFVGWRTPLFWKMLFIPVGFALVYSVLLQWWGMVSVLFVFLLAILFIFLSPQPERRGDNKMAADIENKMKNCC